MTACWAALAGCTRLQHPTDDRDDDGGDPSRSGDLSVPSPSDETPSDETISDGTTTGEETSCDEVTTDPATLASEVTGIDRRPRPRLLETVTVELTVSNDGPCPEQYETPVRLEPDDGEGNGESVSGSLEPSETQSRSVTVRLLETGPVRLTLDGTVVDEFEVRPRPDAGGPRRPGPEPNRSEESTTEVGGNVTIYVETDDSR
ncbi:hypothetical protein B1756_10830 [Natrarchaeobaculum aegyptiacum]|uniref:CARDB domain-containing protein n=1 Tax=Natrarchaeobaculum aegyptiacum TaxID=745377 RepID=A0A2Z2HSH6_9EURY|nr:hypothetical protein B1756_10830 [Natrarchaeobaculum aegyptiacum]